MNALREEVVGLNVEVKVKFLTLRASGERNYEVTQKSTTPSILPLSV